MDACQNIPASRPEFLNLVSDFALYVIRGSEWQDRLRVDSAPEGEV